MNSQCIEAFHNLGINEPDDVIIALLKRNGNVERAINDYFENGKRNIANSLNNNMDPNLSSRQSNFLKLSQPALKPNPAMVRKTSVAPSLLANQTKSMDIKKSADRNIQDKLNIKTSSTVSNIKMATNHDSKKANKSQQLLSSNTSATHTPPNTTNNNNNNSTKKHNYLFVGRRNVHGYALNSGYLLRHHTLNFQLQTKQLTTSTTTSSMKTQTTQQQSTKTKLSPFLKSKTSTNNLTNNKNNHFGKLIFETNKLTDLQISQIIKSNHFEDEGSDDIFGTHPLVSKLSKFNNKTVQGRLPKELCEFLVPLMESNLILLRGHIGYDIGEIDTLHNIPLSVHVYISLEIFNFCQIIENKEISIMKTDTSDSILREHINSLFIWLKEGECEILNIIEQKKFDTALLNKTTTNPTSNSNSNNSNTGGSSSTLAAVRIANNNLIKKESFSSSSSMSTNITNNNNNNNTNNSAESYDVEEPLYDEDPPQPTLEIDNFLLLEPPTLTASNTNNNTSFVSSNNDGTNTTNNHNTTNATTIPASNMTPEMNSMPHPDMLTVTMRPYQLQAVAWMKQREILLSTFMIYICVFICLFRMRFLLHVLYYTILYYLHF